MRIIATSLGLLAAIGSARAEPATYAIDPEHAWVIYEISHFGTSTNRGRFHVTSGTVQLDRAAKSGRADMTIDIATVQTGVPSLEASLRTPDFFSASEFPTGKFVADSFGFEGDKVSTLAGTLTLRGKSHPVTLKALRFNCYQNPMFKREVCGGDFETTIKRSLWGINWGLNFGFADDVRLLVQVEGIKQQ
jgi:polyisoprenoid-binding protein YceI